MIDTELLAKHLSAAGMAKGANDAAARAYNAHPNRANKRKLNRASRASDNAAQRLSNFVEMQLCMDMILLTLDVAQEQPQVTGRLPGGLGFPTAGVPEGFLEEVDLLALSCFRVAIQTGKPVESFEPVVDFFAAHGYHRGPVAARIAKMMQVQPERVDVMTTTFREAFAESAA